MAYVVTDACVRCRYTDCVAVCPVDCFYVGENMLVIHPDECIDCGACEPECPTTAIFEEADLSPGQEVFISINATFSGANLWDVDTTGWPSQLAAGVDNAPWPYISEQRQPLPGAEEAEVVPNKLADVSPNPG